MKTIERSPYTIKRLGPNDYRVCDPRGAEVSVCRTQIEAINETTRLWEVELDREAKRTARAAIAAAEGANQ